MAYKVDGRVKRTIELLEHAIAVMGRAMREYHLSRQMSQRTLEALRAELPTDSDIFI